MISQLPQGVRVPTGFATTAHAFRQFLAYEGLADKISAKLAALDVDDVRALAAVGAEIRAMVEAQPFLQIWKQLSARNLPVCKAAMPKHPLPCVLPLPPKTCPTHRLPVSRKPS